MNTPLIIERTVNAPQAMVWKALSDYSLLKQWMEFFPDFQAKVGFSTAFMLGPDAGPKYKHLVEVVEVINGSKIAFTWHYADYPGNSVVTFAIAADAADKTKTKVVLTHAITQAFPEEDAFSAKNFKIGWTYMVDALKEFTEKK